MSDAPGAPAADHAHLCNHAPDASGDTQGCPRWPSCLAPDAVPDYELRFPSKMTEAEIADFERRFIESLREQLHAPGLLITPYRAPRSPLQRLRRWWRR